MWRTLVDPCKTLWQLVYKMFFFYFLYEPNSDGEYGVTRHNKRVKLSRTKRLLFLKEFEFDLYLLLINLELVKYSFLQMFKCNAIHNNDTHKWNSLSQPKNIMQITYSTLKNTHSRQYKTNAISADWLHWCELLLSFQFSKSIRSIQLS